MYTREILFVEMWAGQLLCEAFNWVLKHIVKEERPYRKFRAPQYSQRVLRRVAGRLRSRRGALAQRSLAQPPHSTKLTFVCADDMGPGYGFPSSHSQWMGYFAAFLVCHFSFRHRFASTGSSLLDKARSLRLYTGIIGWSVAVAFSR